RFMMAVAAEVTEVPPPPPQQQPQSTSPAVNDDAVPTKAPETIAPERRDLPDTVPIGPSLIGVAGAAGVGFDIGQPPPPRVVQAPTPQPPLHVGGVVKPPQKIHHVAPIYPAIAQAARVSGVVILEALIAE